MPEMSDLRGLSLINPWGHLLVTGQKTVENRPRRLPPHLTGRVITLLASLTPEKRYKLDVHAFCEERGLSIDLPAEDLPRGGVIGWAVFRPLFNPGGDLDPGATDLRPELLEAARRWWKPGEFGYYVAGYGQLPFVSCKGAMGFFRLTKAVASQIAWPEGFWEGRLA